RDWSSDVCSSDLWFPSSTYHYLRYGEYLLSPAIHRPHHQHVLYVMNQASPDSRELIFPSGEKYCTTIGTPYPTAKPPRFAINIRVDVNFVISFVSRVSEALSAP